MLPVPVILGDIGGTYARFAVLLDAGPASLPIRRETAADATPSIAIKAALRSLEGPKPRSALLALAGRVDEPAVRLTNAPWIVDAAQIGGDLGLDRVMLVNDYAPVAAALLKLDQSRTGELARIGPPLPPGPGPRLVIGPGTGLGIAALIPIGQCSLIQTTEAGHVEFGPSDDLEYSIWPFLERVHDRVTAEAALSGPGLVRLHRALARARNLVPSCVSPKDVMDKGRSGDDPLASETLRLFARLLGRYAGDLALTFGATGGVYVAGGIAPRMTDILNGGEFRNAFESKAPFGAVMQRIPAFVISHPEPAMVGLAALARTPERFVFEAHGWRAPGKSRAGCIPLSSEEPPSEALQQSQTRSIEHGA